MTKKILIMVSVVMLIALVGCSQKTVKVVIIYGLQKIATSRYALTHQCRIINEHIYACNQQYATDSYKCNG